MKGYWMRGSVLLLSVVFAGSAFAGVPGQRMDRQEQRIHQGVRSGQLTRKEARHLQRGERKVARDTMRARADGKITPRERRHLNREQNRMSRKIFRKKHNLRMRRRAMARGY